MLNFEDRTGPVFDPTPVYPGQGVPEWYRDAKLGFFMHWGLYSVPAWAHRHSAGDVPTEDAYAYHQYAEWYANTVRIPHSPTRERHERNYGVGTSYEDLTDRWDASTFDAAGFVAEIADAGARYFIPTTKHHDGFCLWDSATTTFTAARRGPRRDLVRELAESTRAAGLKFGVYFSGALDWHVSDFPPIESDTELFRFRRNDESFARYAAAQLEELVEATSPDVLWNDIEWPDAGKSDADYALAALLGRYFRTNPDGVVNDRWGVPYHGFLTREYSHVPGIIDQPWEATRGLGFSFGYNQDEGPEQSLSGAALIRLLVDVVSKNGNLLINVGPRADGTVPELQRATMAQLGVWLCTNGGAVYGTRPWVRCGDTLPGSPVAYTTRDGSVYLHALDPAAGSVTVPAELAGRELRWLADGSVRDTPGHDGRVEIPAGLRAQPVAVAEVDRVTQ